MYRIITSKKIAGVTFSVPMVTCDTKPEAIKKMNAAIKRAETELNVDEIALVGGKFEITLDECAHVIGGISDTIARVTVKREINAGKAEIIKDGL